MNTNDESLLPPSQSQSFRDRSDGTTMRPGIAARSKLVQDLPDTMSRNADGTFSIYTTSAMKHQTSRVELYTEIPLLALHGIQTRGEPRECGIMRRCVESLQVARCDCHGTTGRPSLSSSNPSDTRTGSPPTSSTVTTPLLVATIATAMLQFLVGYNIVLMNNLEKHIYAGHETMAWSLAVAALPVGAPFGASMGGRFTAKYGRKQALILTILFFLTGGVIQTLAPSLRIITLGRFIIGIASGTTTVLVPIYLGELAPTDLRGSIGTVNQFAHVIGILVADILSFRLQHETDWRRLSSVTIAIGLAQLLLIPFVVESPRWLYKKNPKDPEAKRILQQIRGYPQQDNHNEQGDVELELSTYIQAMSVDDQEDQSHGILLSQIMSHSRSRYCFICIILLHVMKQFCGVHAVFYYSTSIFDGVMDNPEVATILIASVNVFFTYVALILMDSCRRKTLLLWSFGGMLFSNIALTLSRTGIIAPVVSLIAVNTYVAFFEIGVGPIVWLIVTEMFEAHHVTLVMILCSQVGWTFNFMVCLVFPSLIQLLGDYTFVPFAIALTTGFVFTWIALPETHGRNPNEVLSNVKNDSSISSLREHLAADDWNESLLT